jgi:hypothetical protein
MATKTNYITLDCGFEATQKFNGKNEFLDISLMDLYSGYGENCDPIKLSNLFKELSDKGYILCGMSREMGCYDTIDDMILNATKPKS